MIDKDSFIAGMELAMRICRNRVADLAVRDGKGFDLTDPPQQAIETCIGITRCVQVEIGSGRMPIPEFTQEEKEEMARIR